MLRNGIEKKSIKKRFETKKEQSKEWGLQLK
jgi:hypothetical protein